MKDRLDILIEVDDREIQSYLGQLTVRLQGLEPLLETVADRVEGAIEQSFESEAAPDGSPWAALAPSTLKQKLRLGQSKILVASGRGKASVRITVNENTITCSFEEHMARHQRGTKLLPKRKFAPEPGDIEQTTALGQQIEQDIEKYLSPNFFQFVRGEISRSVRILKGRRQL